MLRLSSGLRAAVTGQARRGRQFLVRACHRHSPFRALALIRLYPHRHAPQPFAHANRAERPTRSLPDLVPSSSAQHSVSIRSLRALVPRKLPDAGTSRTNFAIASRHGIKEDKRLRTPHRGSGKKFVWAVACSQRPPNLSSRLTKLRAHIEHLLYAPAPEMPCPASIQARACRVNSARICGPPPRN